MEELLEYFYALEGQTRDQCAEKYRELLLKKEVGEHIDFQEINLQIEKRWSISGLDYILKKAWLVKAQNGNRTWVTAKNRDLQWDVFLISAKNWGATFRVGFGDYASAKAHLENIKASPRA